MIGGIRGDDGGTIADVGVVVGDNIRSNRVAFASSSRSDSSGSNNERREAAGRRRALQRFFSWGRSSDLNNSTSIGMTTGISILLATKLLSAVVRPRMVSVVNRGKCMFW